MNTYYIMMYCIGCYFMAAIFGHYIRNLIFKKFINGSDPMISGYTQMFYKLWREHPYMIDLRRDPVVIILVILILLILIPFIIPVLCIIMPVHWLKRAIKGSPTSEQIREKMQKGQEIIGSVMANHGMKDLKELGVSDELMAVIKEANEGVNEKSKTWTGQEDIIKHYQPFHERVKDQVPDLNEFFQICAMDLQRQSLEQQSQDQNNNMDSGEQQTKTPDNN